MHDQMGVDHARLLQLVGDDATDEVGLGGAQCGHQVVELLLVGGRYCGEATALLATSAFAAAATATSITGLSRMIGEDLYQQLVGGLLELVDYRVVQRILVLLQPAGDVIRYLKHRANIQCRNRLKAKGDYVTSFSYIIHLFRIINQKNYTSYSRKQRTMLLRFISNLIKYQKLL